MSLPISRVFQENVIAKAPTPGGMTGHDVQFYRSEAHLIRTVVDFLAAGVRVGQPLVVIATDAHRKAFAEALTRQDLDTEELLSGREAIWLDARETLTAFMEGRVPNRELFMATVGSVFERALRKRYYLVVRGYGEMVDLLWRDGNTEGALLLETLWNELAAKYSYSLLCGYSLDNFLHETAASDIVRVCGHHTNALPLESEWTHNDVI